MAKLGAKIVTKKGNNDNISIPSGMTSNISMPEYFSELLSYAPQILKEGVKSGDVFERFKITLKFAFSILHNLTFQDAFAQRPVVPMVGDTYEGHYIGQEVTDIYMETDYLKLYLTDMLTLKQVKVKIDEATNYIHIEGLKGLFQVFGNLTYK